MNTNHFAWIYLLSKGKYLFLLLLQFLFTKKEMQYQSAVFLTK